MALARTLEHPRFPGLVLVRIVEVLIVFQPLLGGLVYISILTGHPPLWASWTAFLFPFVLRWWRYRILFKRTPFDIPIAVFSIALVVGVVVSPDKAVSLETFQTYIACILIYYMVVAEATRVRWYWKLVVLVIFVFLLALALLTFNGDMGGKRILPFNQWLYQAGGLSPFGINYFVDSNALGMLAGIFLSGCLAFALLSRELKSRTVAGILAAVAASLLIMAASMSGFWAVLVGVGILITLWKPWVLIAYIPFGLGGLWLALSKFYPEYNLSATLHFPSLVGRYHIWTDVFEMVKAKALTGVGLGVFARQYKEATGGFMIHPHNDFIQLFSDGGVISVLAAVSATTIAIWLALRILWSRKKDADVWTVLGLTLAVGLATVVVHGLFEVSVSGILVDSENRGALISYHSVAIPLTWAIGGMFSASYMLCSSNEKSHGSQPLGRCDSQQDSTDGDNVPRVGSVARCRAGHGTLGEQHG